MGCTQSGAVEVRRVRGKGRGVFARRAIREAELIERVPVLVLPESVLTHDDEPTILACYGFLWGRGTVAITLGYGSLYNHSYRPNARYDDESPRMKVFTALRNIEAGEEITINYNGDPEDRSDVGFGVIEAGAGRAPYGE